MSEKTIITMRQPSTANLLISSFDRTSGQYASSFSINKNNSILNGFFTRIGLTELALDWAVPNIGSDNSGVTFDLSGGTSIPFTIPVGSYSAADALDTIVARFNVQPSRGGATLAVTSTGGIVTLTITGGTGAFRITSGGILADLGFTFGGAYSATKSASTSNPIGTGISHIGYSPYWLDFVCNNLTYNQELKDASTSNNTKDVLCRYYLASSNENQAYDKYGYPLLMPYKPFYVRRTWTPPKQIKWDSKQPVGQLIFEVYDQDGVLVREGFEWNMTVQVTEN